MQHDFTKGPIRKNLILFSLPLIAGNLLQQLYNIVDTWVVGKYISEEALAAVGSAFALMILLNSLILGLCMGSSVVFSQMYGNNDIKALKQAVFNAFVLTSVVSLTLLFLSYLLLPNIILLMRIPTEVINLFKSYLLIIFAGIPFTFLYNFFASFMRSIGKSVAPLFFLLVSTIMNILLDFLFVLSLDWGVEGAALATVLAQMISAIGMSTFTFRYNFKFKLHKNDVRINIDLLKRIAKVSSLTSIQQSIMNFGILMVQSLVNSFGVATMAAFTAGVKIDSFAYSPAQDFANGFSTFVAQNKGTQNISRINKGIKEAITISALFCGAVSILIFIFARPLLSLFIDSNQAVTIAIGVQYLRTEGLFYIGIGILFLMYSIYRGLEKAGMSIILTIISLGLRVLISYSFAPKLGVIIIWLSIPIGWIIADIVGLSRIKRTLKIK